MSASMNPAGILITQAQVPERWPPTPEHAPDVLLDLFSQHLIARRDWVVRRAYQTLVQRQPYARGRVHQRPFAVLEGFQLDADARDALVDVVAVFVDEALEHTLSLFGAQTNLVGEYDAVDYELTAHVVHEDRTVDQRFSTEALTADWRGHLGQIVAEDQGGSEPRVAGGGVPDMTEDEAAHAASRIPIGRGDPLWFDYRKWLSKYCTFRRSARPSRHT
jgi:hypothetical protein